MVCATRAVPDVSAGLEVVISASSAPDAVEVSEAVVAFAAPAIDATPYVGDQTMRTQSNADGGKSGDTIAGYLFSFSRS